MASVYANILKPRWAPFLNPLPEVNTIADFAPLVPPEQRNGLEYRFPIRTGLPGSVTTDDTRTAATLASVIAPTFGQAVITAAALIIRDNVSYSDIFATSNGTGNGGDGGGAYFSVWDQCMKGIMLSGNHYREVACLYGPGPSSTALTSLGTINANTNSATLNTGAIVNITAATWAPALWQNMNNHLVDIYASDLSTVRAAGVTLTMAASMQASNRLTLTKSGSSYTCVAGDVILVGSAIDVSMVGLQGILANTGSLFGIDAATVPMWQAFSFNVNGALGRDKIQGMAARMVHTGHTSGGTLFCSGPALADCIMEAQEILRVSPSENSKIAVQGNEGVSYVTPIGRIDLKVHPYMKQGIGMFLPSGLVVRPGSTDNTFRAPGSKNDWFMTELADKAGTQMRLFGEYAILVKEPYKACLLTGIDSTYDTDPA